MSEMIGCSGGPACVPECVRAVPLNALLCSRWAKGFGKEFDRCQIYHCPHPVVSLASWRAQGTRRCTRLYFTMWQADNIVAQQQAGSKLLKCCADIQTTRLADMFTVNKGIAISRTSIP